MENFKYNNYRKPAILIIYLILITCRKNVYISDIDPVTRIKTAVVETETCAPIISGFGTVIYENKADIYPGSDSIINLISVRAGDYVDKGTILAELDYKKLSVRKTQAEADVKSKKVKVSLAEIRLNEGRKEAEKNIIAVLSADIYAQQKKAELDYVKRLYNNKKELYDAEGISFEDLETYRIRFISAENDYYIAHNEWLIKQTGYTDTDIINAGYLLPLTDYDRIEIIKKINTLYLEAELLYAETELLSFKAELYNINLLIDESTIRSPVSGIVADTYFDAGEKVTTQNRLFTVFNTDNIFVKVNISSSEIDKIKKYQSVNIYTSRGVISGRVEIIKPFINPETGSSEIRILANNAGNAIIPGAFARVEIQTGENAQRLFLPENTVITENEKAYIFLIRNGKLFKKEIKKSFKQNNRIYFEESAFPGDLVCINPQKSYIDGMDVEVAE